MASAGGGSDEDGYFASLTMTNTSGSLMSPEQEILSILGAPRDSLTTVIPMTLVYVMILVTGLVGNLCTCFVIVKNKYMHTTVNFYLFSLAVSDLVLLIVGLPTELWAFWQKYPYVFGETFCILRALISEACSYASVLTITAFTVERYIAICHPLKAHTMSQLSRAVKAILLIWVIATLSSIPISLQLGIIIQVTELFYFLECVVDKSLCNRLFESEIEIRQETSDGHSSVCTQKLQTLCLHDLDHHLLRRPHESDSWSLLPDRTAVTPQLPSNGS